MVETIEVGDRIMATDWPATRGKRFTVKGIEDGHYGPVVVALDGDQKVRMIPLNHCRKVKRP